jgi:hypothetical protein
MKKVFYTYAYLREDGRPYYIGKGCGNRCYDSWGRCAKTPKDKSRILILKRGLSEEEAFKHEIYLIAILGKKCDGGMLHNIQDGGSAPPRMCGENHPNFGGAYSKVSSPKIAKTLSSLWEITFKSGEVVKVENLAQWCRENPDYRCQNVYAVAVGRLPTYKGIAKVVKLKQGKSPPKKKNDGNYYHRAREVEVRFVGGEVEVYSCVRLVAVALNVSATTVNRWLNGSVSPHPKHRVERITQV